MMKKADIEAFIALLKQHSRSWSEAADELGAQPGLRVIIFDGDSIRAALCKNEISYYLGELFKQLPPDAALIDIDGQLIRLAPNYDTYFDKWSVIVASQEWEPLKDGAEIPEFTPIIIAQPSEAREGST